MAHRANVKIVAETKDAIRSVKDLESNIEKIQRLSEKGTSNRGILDERDVLRYRRYTDSILRIKQNLNDQLLKLDNEIHARSQAYQGALQ